MTATISRRTVLKGLTVSLTAAAIGPTTGRPAWGASPSPSSSPFVRPASPPASPPSSNWSFPLAPYQLQSSVVLSEDYFTSSQVILGDAGDQLYAFRNGTDLNALVLTNGALSHLFRDAGSPSGWTYASVTGVLGVTTMAVGNGPDGTPYAIVSGNNGNIYTMLGAFEAGGWAWTGLTGTPHQVLRSTYDQNGNLYFYEVLGDGTVQYYWAGKGGSSMSQDTSARAMVQEYGQAIENGYLALETADDGYTFTNVLIHATVQGGGGAWTFESSGQVGQDTHPGTVAIGAGALPDAPHLSYNDYLFDADSQDPGRYLMYSGSLPMGIDPAGLNGSATQASMHTIDPTVSSSGYALLVQSASQTSLITTTQTLDNTSGVIPLLQQSTQFAAADRGLLDSFFYVDADLAINYLARTPGSLAWQSYPVHQGTEVHYSFQVWRVELTLLDASGTPVPGVTLQLTADSAVDLWLDTGGVLLNPGQASSFITNPLGRVTVTIPAMELSAPPLTVSGDHMTPVVIAPDRDVHTYLAGGASLNHLAPLSGDALQNATTNDADASPVFPGVSAVTAAAAASAVSAGMTAGATAGQTPAAGAVQSFNVTMTGGTVSYSSSPSPQDLDQAVRRLARQAGVDSVGSWWDSVKQDAESVYHGIRTGVIAVSHVTASYVEATKTWAMKLAIAIGDEITDVIDLAVSDLNSAVHFVSAVFHALGADIARAIKWLAAEVTGLLEHTVQNADILLGWLHQAEQGVGTVLASFSADADGFFGSQKDSFNGWIASLQQQFQGQTLSQLAGPPAQLSTTRHRRRLRDSTGPSSPTTAGTPAHANWLQHKLSEIMPDFELPHDPTSDTLLGQLAGVFDNAEVFSDVETAASGCWNALLTLVDDPKDFHSVGVADLLGALEGVVDFAFDIADKAIVLAVKLAQAALAAFNQLLDTSLADIPLMGELLRLAGISDTTLTFGRLMCLVAMFPATLANQLTHGVDDPLFDLPKGAASRGVGVSLGRGLNIGAGVTMGLLAICDTAVDAAGGAAKLEGTPWGKFLVAMDIVLPTIVQTLTYPGEAGNAPFATLVPNATPIEKLNESAYAIAWVVPALAIATASPLSSVSWVETAQPWVNSVFGLFLIVGGAFGASGTGASAAGVAATVLGNLPMFFSFCLTDSFEADTGEGSFPFKLVVDLFANAGAGIAMGFA